MPGRSDASTRPVRLGGTIRGADAWTRARQEASWRYLVSPRAISRESSFAEIIEYRSLMGQGDRTEIPERSDAAGGSR